GGHSLAPRRARPQPCPQRRGPFGAAGGGGRPRAGPRSAAQRRAEGGAGAPAEPGRAGPWGAGAGRPRLRQEERWRHLAAAPPRRRAAPLRGGGGRCAALRGGGAPAEGDEGLRESAATPPCGARDPRFRLPSSPGLITAHGARGGGAGKQCLRCGGVRDAHVAGRAEVCVPGVWGGAFVRQ
ncbi:unnamed protein product, partial [Bubo scandiacus]